MLLFELELTKSMAVLCIRLHFTFYELYEWSSIATWHSHGHDQDTIYLKSIRLYASKLCEPQIGPQALIPV